MSIIIEVNGTRVEAETLKEAQRLARKEERRQDAAYQARTADKRQAYVHAYATIGALACQADSGIEILQGDQLACVYMSDGRVRLDSMYDGGCFFFPLTDNDRLDAVATDARGNAYAVKVARGYSAREEWSAVGQCRLEEACQALPASLAERLDNLAWVRRTQQAA